MCLKVAVVIVLVALIADQSNGQESSAMKSIDSEMQAKLIDLRGRMNSYHNQALQTINTALTTQQTSISHATERARASAGENQDCVSKANQQLKTIQDSSKRNLESCASSSKHSMEPARQAANASMTELANFMKESVTKCKNCGIDFICHTILAAEVSLRASAIAVNNAQRVDQYGRSSWAASNNGVQCMQKYGAKALIDIEKVSQEAETCSNNH
ncbi:uncharacterized protein [Anabrus simplex]|uniref:uncharacterized protein isoform X2 n=1 Tax=Anabrus simplex TaxID=316456 RepID=UPI0035A2D7B3